MKFGELIEFKKELYFEGAVQIDWFYNPSKAANVAENFVFHSKNYFGVETNSIHGKKRIDTISLVKALTDKLQDDSVTIPSLAIADYGTGKSHLAVTLAQLFSGPDYMPKTYSKILKSINALDKEAYKAITQNCDGRNFVMVINGMRDFNLHAEILRAAQKSLDLYGLPDDSLKKLNRALDTAGIFLDRNIKSSFTLFEKYAHDTGWSEKGDKLSVKLKKELFSGNDEAFEIINKVYYEINGQEIRWDEGLSASSILEMLVSEYCGMNGKYDHIIILFDEFGRYLEYASGVNAAKSGDSALQQIFEAVQNSNGALQVINFIQSDIKTYLQRVDQTKNISRYIGRYDSSDKYYISSNLETVIANLIQRKNEEVFKSTIVSWQNSKEEYWKETFENINKWLIPKGMWKDYSLFRKVVVEGIYPMHPLSTFMLTQLSDYLQNRSSLTFISQYIDKFSDEKINKSPLLIMPEFLMTGDLYIEMLAAEQDGKQPSQQCILYDNVLRKFGDKLSENSLKVLRSNLILRILRFRTSDYEDAKTALAFVSGLPVEDIEEELNWLENEYAILGFDEHAGCFDFMEESNGAHDFKVIKKRLIASTKLDNSYINDLKIQEIAGILEVQLTGFGQLHKISTTEWQFKQELYPIESLKMQMAESYISEWHSATTSIAAKGKLIWLYVNKNTDPKSVEYAQKLVSRFENTPIVTMLINDEENRLFEYMLEYYVLDHLDDSNRKKYDRYFNDAFKQAESNLKGEFEELKKKRILFKKDGSEAITNRMQVFLTNVFENLYPKALPFCFDSFITKANNVGGKGGSYFCSIIKMLLSGSVNEDSIHNFPSDLRNRIDALLMTSNNTSWKCINDQYHLIPPENNRVKAVYKEISEELNISHEKNCSEIFTKYSMPPYGMSEDVITLMIAVVSANLSYCLRFNYKGELKNINAWKDLVVIKDKKIDVDVIKNSTFVVVDSGAVAEKFKRIFYQIQNNKLLSNVTSLAENLERMRNAEEIPDEINSEYFLAKNIVDKGLNALKNWNDEIKKINTQLDLAVNNSDFYSFLSTMQKLNSIPTKTYFEDNGFEFDDESKNCLLDLKKTISSFIDDGIDKYISNMYCKSVEGVNTFKNHNSKIQTLLEQFGFKAYAKRVAIQREKELENIGEIRSRQELKSDIDKFLNKTIMKNHTSLIEIKDWVKEANDLQIRIEKYKQTLGSDANTIADKLNNRKKDLEQAIYKIEEEISSIWDKLEEIKDITDIATILDRISKTLCNHISPEDEEDLTEIQENLTELAKDVEKLNSTSKSRKDFETVSQEFKDKYKDSDFSFEVNEIIEELINTISKELDENETKWKKANLTLGDKSRKSIHKWKENIDNLPDYLSSKTLTAIKKLDKEAEIIIKDGKIEDVLFYFKKLDKKEQDECLEKLKALL